MYITVMCFHRSCWFTEGSDYMETGDNDGNRFQDVIMSESLYKFLQI